MEIVERSFIPLGEYFIRVGDIKSFKKSDHETLVTTYDGNSYCAPMNSEEFLSTLVKMYRAALFPPKPKTDIEKPKNDKDKA